MVLDEEMVRLKRFFLEHDMKLSDYWLESCVAWCREQSSSCTERELQTQIYEQWLLLDLKDVEIPVLPVNANQEIKSVLHGKFPLQLLEVVDISRPKLYQINKIRNATANSMATLRKDEQDEAIGTGKRCLQLTLTDGVQEIKAFEHGPVPQLKLNLTPGMKIQVIGPVKIRRGRIMLEAQNVKLLGGEVEELLVSNAAENVLARALNLPPNPKPNVMAELDPNQTQSSWTQSNQTQSNQTQPNQNQPNQNQSNQNQLNQNRTNINQWNQNMTNQNRSNQIPSNQTQSNQNQSNQNDHYQSNRSNQAQYQNTRPAQETVDFADDFDDDILLAADILEKEQKPIQKQETIASTRVQSPDIFEDMDMELDYLESVEFESSDLRNRVSESNQIPQSNQSPQSNQVHQSNQTWNQVCQSNQISNQASQSSSPSITHPSSSLPSTSHPLPSDQSTQSNNKSTQPTLPISRPRGLTIGHLIRMKENVSKGRFKCHAKFKTVTEKLNFTEEEWRLRIVIEDDTEEMEVVVHSDVVTEIIGYCPGAMIELKNLVRNNDPCAKDTILETLSKLRDKLISLDCLMDILLEKNKMPLIIKLHE